MKAECLTALNITENDKLDIVFSKKKISHDFDKGVEHESLLGLKKTRWVSETHHPRQQFRVFTTEAFREIKL